MREELQHILGNEAGTFGLIEMQGWVSHGNVFVLTGRVVVLALKMVKIALCTHWDFSVLKHELTEQLTSRFSRAWSVNGMMKLERLLVC